MDRQQRFEALTAISELAATRLAERILDGSLGDVAVITPPTVGMIMARAQDGARGEVFNLGEVLVTEARVSIAGREGWGMVLGGRPTTPFRSPWWMPASRPATPMAPPSSATWPISPPPSRLSLPRSGSESLRRACSSTCSDVFQGEPQRDH